MARPNFSLIRKEVRDQAASSVEEAKRRLLLELDAQLALQSLHQQRSLLAMQEIPELC